MPDRGVRRKILSQNFLVDRRAVDALVDGADLAGDDLVLDIGAGNGLISEALARRGARVVAIERDPALARRLRTRFGTSARVTVVEADVLATPLPDEPFRVVANIPFGITTKILRRLLDEGATLTRADVIVQAEVARKRGTPGRGTLLNACWEPWFEFGIGVRIPAAAFRPRPRVDAAVLIVSRRGPPLLDPRLRREYGGFVTTAFEAARPTVASALTRPLPRSRFAGLAAELGFPLTALPSQLTAPQWVALFQAARRSPGNEGRPAPPPRAPTPRGAAPRGSMPGGGGASARAANRTAKDPRADDRGAGRRAAGGQGAGDGGTRGQGVGRPGADSQGAGGRAAGGRTGGTSAPPGSTPRRGGRRPR